MQRERQRQAELARRRQRAQHAARRVLHDARRHAFVGDARASSRAAHRSVLPVSSRSSAAGAPVSSRQPLHAAPAGHDAEHHFGQAEPRAGLVDDDAIAARERELEPAAQAEAADQRQRRIARRCARRSNVSQPRLHERDRAGLVLDVAELVDVGAGDEAARLARADDQALAADRARAGRALRSSSASTVGGQRVDASRRPCRASGVAMPVGVAGEVQCACDRSRCRIALRRLVRPARRASRRPGRRRCRSRPCRACRRCARAR